MTARADHVPPVNIVEGSYAKDKDYLETLELTNGKPPRDLSRVRLCESTAQLVATPKLVSAYATTKRGFVSGPLASDVNIFRSGSCSEIGPKTYMEDEYISIDNLLDHLGTTVRVPSPAAFYGVFDGHGGSDASSFIRSNILSFITQNSHFPTCVGKAIHSAFLEADQAFANTTSLDSSSGTTILTTLIFGRFRVLRNTPHSLSPLFVPYQELQFSSVEIYFFCHINASEDLLSPFRSIFVANAGDCRAVLGRRGRAIDLSKDHKPSCPSERLRIEKVGGAVYDGYLNGQLSVARAIGDWHMKRSKGSSCPLIAEPELQEIVLTEEDEFLIMGCDGLWDVMSSQCAVTIARKELMLHNDPERCSRELVREAFKRNTCDNVTVVVVCFSQDPPPQLEIPKSKLRGSISTEGLNLLQHVLHTGL
ncbi:PPM-type phosphatase-like domain [Dillenia turbinata]|uniref:protein-serine/threonine phosphatase n=1 Tax=Dillenia turbinata TaxID=194707 RepID=A0AAN8WHE9_9MAGN